MDIKSECQAASTSSQVRGRYCLPFFPLVSLLVTCILFGWLYHTSGQEMIIAPFWLVGATIFTVGCMLCYLVDLSHACDSYGQCYHSHHYETDFMDQTESPSWLKKAGRAIMNFLSPSPAFEFGECGIYNSTALGSKSEPIGNSTIATEPASYHSLGPDYKNGLIKRDDVGEGKVPKNTTVTDKMFKMIVKWFHPSSKNSCKDESEVARATIMPEKEVRTCRAVQARTPQNIKSAELNTWYCDPTDNKLWRVVEKRMTSAEVDVPQGTFGVHHDLEVWGSIDECAYQIKVTAIVCVLVTLAVLIPLIAFPEEERNMLEAVARQLQAGFDAIKSYFN